MAISQTLTQVTWSAATTGTVTTNSNLTSDIMALDATCVAAQIQFKAETGTAVSGDYINFYVLQSSGDPDAAESADEYDTVGHAIFLARVDCFITDPALVTVPFPLPQKNFKIYAQGDHADATSQNITVACQIIEQRVS